MNSNTSSHPVTQRPVDIPPKNATIFEIKQNYPTYSNLMKRYYFDTAARVFVSNERRKSLNGRGQCLGYNNKCRCQRMCKGNFCWEH